MSNLNVSQNILLSKDESQSVSWENDNLLTDEYNTQVKLVAKSLADSSAPNNKMPTPKNNNSNKPQQHTLSHKSRKYRFDDNPIKVDADFGDTNELGKTSESPKPPVILPPFDPSIFPQIEKEDDARASMLMSWYMAGYHTGYYEAMRKSKK